MKVLAFLLMTTAVLNAADVPLPAGAKPHNLGSVDAGEGPAWDGKGNLYFTGDHRITIRDSNGKIGPPADKL